MCTSAGPASQSDASCLPLHLPPPAWWHDVVESPLCLRIPEDNRTICVKGFDLEDYGIHASDFQVETAQTSRSLLLGSSFSKPVHSLAHLTDPAVRTNSPESGLDWPPLLWSLCCSLFLSEDSQVSAARGRSNEGAWLTLMMNYWSFFSTKRGKTPILHHILVPQCDLQLGMKISQSVHAWVLWSFIPLCRQFHKTSLLGPR